VTMAAVAPTASAARNARIATPRLLVRAGSRRQRDHDPSDDWTRPDWTSCVNRRHGGTENADRRGKPDLVAVQSAFAGPVTRIMPLSQGWGLPSAGPTVQPCARGHRG
jgi:hypothetical protein